MKYRLVNSKAGWVIQNINTYSIVPGGPYSTEMQANAVLHKLTTDVKAAVKRAETRVINGLNKPAVNTLDNK